MEKTKIKLVTIDNADIPKGRLAKPSEYIELFKNIPKGKSLKINSKDLNIKPESLCVTLYKLMKKESLPRYKIYIRKEKDKSKTVYVSNP